MKSSAIWVSFLGTFKIKLPNHEPFSRHEKNPKTSILGFFWIYISIFLFIQMDILHWFSLRALVLMIFKIIIWPNLIVLNLVVHSPKNNYDFLESFVVNIDLHIFLIDYIAKYDIPTLYESKRSRIQLFLLGLSCS
jgi:hypothetical protein